MPANAAILVLEDETDLAFLLQQNLQQQGHAVTCCETVSKARAALAEAPADLLLLDVNLPDGLGTDLLSENVFSPNTAVVVCTAEGGVQGAVEAIKNGAQDYLLKPVSAEDLNAALNRADEVETASPDDDNQLGRLIAVVGARGGVGASTVSANIAWMMAHEQGLRVALIDLDLYFGTLALALDMEPGLGFREALENPSRIDGLFIERAMVRESDNLYILAAEEGLENSFSFDPKALDRLLETLRADFDCVVIDLPRFAARSQISTLIPPASVVVVSDPTLAGMRDTQRLAKLVKTVTPDSELSIVVNRVGNSKNGELTIKDFESGAELSVDHQIPCDVKSAILAEGAGKTVAEIAKATKMSQTLRDLSRNVSGRVEDVVQAPMWKRLMGRG